MQSPARRMNPAGQKNPAAAATDGPGSELWQLDCLQVLEKHVQGFQFSYWVPFIITSPEIDKVTVSVPTAPANKQEIYYFTS